MSNDKVRVAIVGGATLKGKELADALRERRFPAGDIRLLDDDEARGQLESVGDEINFVQEVRPDQFEHMDVVFFASDEESTRRHWKLAQAAGAAIVDVSYGLEDQTPAVVRAPWIERELGRPFIPELQPRPVVVAHPAAMVLALLLLRARKASALRTAIAVVVEPASERGRAGMDELHEQTVDLLSFRDLPRQVFGAQVAFNMIARYGAQARPALDEVGRRISSHFQRIMGDPASSPALLVLQGASFHSHTLAIYLDLANRMNPADFAAALAGDHVIVTRDPNGDRESGDYPSSVSAAGQDQVLAAVQQDRNSSGFWIWAAADNLRLPALNAIECAEGVILARPKGAIQ